MISAAAADAGAGRFRYPATGEGLLAYVAAMRLIKALRAGLGEMRGFGPRLWNILRQLGNEVIGFLFFALMLFFVFSANGLRDAVIRAVKDPNELPHVILPAAFVLICGGFGVSSFRRARRIAREAPDEK